MKFKLWDKSKGEKNQTFTHHFVCPLEEKLGVDHLADDGTVGQPHAFRISGCPARVHDRAEIFLLLERRPEIGFSLKLKITDQS